MLVVLMDADLYSSNSTVLEYVKQRLLPGSYLYFDQFHHRCDELRTFAELLDESSLVSSSLLRAAILRTSRSGPSLEGCPVPLGVRRSRRAHAARDPNPMRSADTVRAARRGAPNT